MIPGPLRLLGNCAVCLAAFVSAARGDDGASKEDVAYFEQHIRPLLAERCFACHSVREKKQKGGLLLDSRAGWTEGGDRGPALIPGDLDASLLIRAVRYTDPDLRMPPDVEGGSKWRRGAAEFGGARLLSSPSCVAV